MVEQQPIRTCRDCVFCHSSKTLNNSIGGNSIDKMDSCKVDTPKGKKLKNLRPCPMYRTIEEVASRHTITFIEAFKNIRTKQKLSPEEQLMWEILTDEVKHEHR
jgi:hypothetical protein